MFRISCFRKMSIFQDPSIPADHEFKNILIRSNLDFYEMIRNIERALKPKSFEMTHKLNNLDSSYSKCSLSAMEAHTCYITGLNILSSKFTSAYKVVGGNLAWKSCSASPDRTRIRIVTYSTAFVLGLMCLRSGCFHSDP